MLTTIGVFKPVESDGQPSRLDQVKGHSTLTQGVVSSPDARQHPTLPDQDGAVLPQWASALPEAQSQASAVPRDQSGSALNYASDDQTSSLEVAPSGDPRPSLVPIWTRAMSKAFQASPSVAFSPRKMEAAVSGPPDSKTNGRVLRKRRGDVGAMSSDNRQIRKRSKRSEWPTAHSDSEHSAPAVGQARSDLVRDWYERNGLPPMALRPGWARHVSVWRFCYATEHAVILEFQRQPCERCQRRNIPCFVEVLGKSMACAQCALEKTSCGHYISRPLGGSYTDIQESYLSLVRMSLSYLDPAYPLQNLSAQHPPTWYQSLWEVSQQQQQESPYLHSSPNLKVVWANRDKASALMPKDFLAPIMESEGAVSEAELARCLGPVGLEIDAKLSEHSTLPPTSAISNTQEGSPIRGGRRHPIDANSRGPSEKAAASDKDPQCVDRTPSRRQTRSSGRAADKSKAAADFPETHSDSKKPGTTAEDRRLRRQEKAMLPMEAHSNMEIDAPSSEVTGIGNVKSRKGPVGRLPPKVSGLYPSSQCVVSSQCPLRVVGRHR